MSFSLIKLAALVFVSMSCIVIGDTAGKLLTGQGVPPGFVAWSRFFLAAVILLPFSGLKLSECRGLLNWRVFLRGALVSCGIFCILNALRTEPIANVFGAFFIAPIVSYILAVLFLGERPSRQRSVLLGVGFLGVLLVVRPGINISQGMIFALATGVFYGGFLAMTRVVAENYRPRFLLISQLLIGSALLAPVGLSAQLPVVSSGIVFLVVLSALGSALGNFLLLLANRAAEASLIAPLVYTQLISATLAGVLVFGEWPDLLTLFGLGLILFSGLGSLAVDQRGPAKSS